MDRKNAERARNPEASPVEGPGTGLVWADAPDTNEHRKQAARSLAVTMPSDYLRDSL
jgi:hypothetical protein